MPPCLPHPLQAQYELFVAAALGTGLSVTALLMPIAAPDGSGEIGESGTYPKELPLGLSFWLGPLLNTYPVPQPCRTYRLPACRAYLRRRPLCPEGTTVVRRTSLGRAVRIAYRGTAGSGCYSLRSPPRS